MKTTETFWEVQWFHHGTGPGDPDEWGFVNRTKSGEEAGRTLYAEALVSGRSCSLRLVKIVETKETTVEVLEPHGDGSQKA